MSSKRRSFSFPKKTVYRDEYPVEERRLYPPDFEKEAGKIMKSLPVNTIMTTRVISIGPDETMEKVREIFETQNIHHLPVVDDGKVIGMISKSDYLKLLHSFTVFQSKTSNHYNEAVLNAVLVGEVMTKQLTTIRPDHPLEVAVGIFRENLFRALPVLDKDGKLVGILTTMDLLNYAFSE